MLVMASMVVAFFAGIDVIATRHVVDLCQTRLAELLQMRGF